LRGYTWLQLVCASFLSVKSVLRQGAQETAEFCRFWRFSASVSRDCRGGIMAGFCTLVWHHPPSWHQLYIFVGNPYNSTFTLWLPIRNSVPACFSCFLCYFFTYALVFLPVVLFVGFPDGVLLGSFLLAKVRPPIAFFLL
jgi:hypothetical protein